MAKKPVTLKNHTFNSQRAAKNYFNEKMYKLKEENKLLDSGELYDDLMEVYTLYCEYSDDEYADLPKRVVGFTAKNNITNYSGDDHTTNICFFAVYKDGKDWDFSIHKAIACISQNQNN